MKKNTVYIIPSDDPHLSEYVPAAYMRRGYLTDFHGSAGTALVTKDAAYLWSLDIDETGPTKGPYHPQIFGRSCYISLHN